jgi:arylsulfatase A-like enzyme
VFADQWRAQATGYAGNPDVNTPRLDALARESVVYSNAVSNCPVCSPFRASLITGQYPLTHGVFLNDLQLSTRAVSLAQAYNQAGYMSAYIGKWHLDGSGRSAYIPQERRQGFEYWKVLECTHDYNHSEYYAGDDPVKRVWPGYDAVAQTDDAIKYLETRANDRKPFALCLSWGSPHAPYRTGPKELVEAYDQKPLTLRKNVPADAMEEARKTTAGYYAHIAALDQCMGKLIDTLKSNGLDRNTIVVFTSDHGDMLHSRGMMKKQRPWDESIRIPFILRCPTQWDVQPKTIDAPLSVPDMMPTLLALSHVSIPATVEGQDLSREILGMEPPAEDRGALILCPCPFGQWTRRGGGQEYRGVRTKRYTYVRHLKGPWLLYDNQNDPFQQNNLVDDPAVSALQARLDRQLQALLNRTGDRFLSGPELVRQCGYRVDGSETVAYHDPAFHGQVSVCCRDQ